MRARRAIVLHEGPAEHYLIAPEEEPMPAYLIANVDVHDPARYERYRELVPATIEKFGGRYLARGGAVETLEGGLPLRRFVIVEFPSSEAAKAWWASEEYAPVKRVRHETATSDLVIIEGL